MFVRGRCSARMGLVGLTVLAACGVPEYESEHAVVATDKVDRVCAGTLAKIDATIESIDAELGRETDSKPIRIHVVDADELIEPCKHSSAGCVSHGDVFLARSSFDDALAHEIVHERVERSSAGNSAVMFSEGIASALGMARPAPNDDREPPSVDSMLRASGAGALNDLDGGYYYAGELTSHLIETYGMSEVLEFMAVLARGDSPKRIRDAYVWHFGSDIEIDLFRYARVDDELMPEQLGCFGPELARDPARPRFHLETELDCDSTRVENEWTASDRIFVEWTIRIDEDDAGLWAPVRAYGDDAIPDDTVIEIEPCRRGAEGSFWSRTMNRAIVLEPGLHRVRWSGSMHDALDLDVELGGPCDLTMQDCADGERCIGPGVCKPAVE